MMEDTKTIIISLLFKIINCHIYVNHIMQFLSFYLRK